VCNLEAYLGVLWNLLIMKDVGTLDAILVFL
jgi:hypothetical protein